MRLHLAEGVCTRWARELVQKVEQKDKHADFENYPSPPGWDGTAFVKVYRRRPKHNLLRLLSASRAALEAAGYHAFFEQGLMVPELLAWGEARNMGMFEFGVVVTLRVAAQSIADAYKAGKPVQRDELLVANVEELARIHKAGLAHGDPYTRNFLALEPGVMSLDLASWSPLHKKSQTQDLTRFACSIIKLTGDLQRARQLLEHYRALGPQFPASVDEIMVEAVALAEVKTRA